MQNGGKCIALYREMIKDRGERLNKLSDEQFIQSRICAGASRILFPRATSQVAACRHLATAARVKYPAALQRCKFDTPLLAAGSLIDR